MRTETASPKQPNSSILVLVFSGVCLEDSYAVHGVATTSAWTIHIRDFVVQKCSIAHVSELVTSYQFSSASGIADVSVHPSPEETPS